MVLSSQPSTYPQMPPCSEKHDDSDTSLSVESEKASIDESYFDSTAGWIVVIAASCSLFVYLGVIYSWGVMQITLAETASSSLTTLTFIGSLATSCMVSLCIFSAKLTQRYGHRRVALTSAFLMGLGEFLASWFTGHIAAIFVTHGVVFGIGGGLSIFACSTAPLPWFRRHRGLATGIVFGGGSLGAAVMGVAMTFLLERLGVEWVFRILGCLLWTICLPCAWFIRQPPSPEKPNVQLQWYRFKEKEFLILLIGTALSSFPLFIPPYFIPIFSRAVSDSRHTGIICLTVWNIASTVGRVMGGYVADSFLGPINSFILSTFLAGIGALTIWPFASSMGVLMLFTIINGTGCGAFFSLAPTVVTAVFGPQNTMGVLPMIWASWFFGFFFGSPIASGLYAMSKEGNGIEAYRPATYYAGSISLVGMVFIVYLRYRQCPQLWGKV